MKSSLTLKQRRFVEYYNGNATQAAIKAGYSKNYTNSDAFKLLQKPAIIKAITDREKFNQSSHIATRKERQQFWSNIMKDEEIPIVSRLRASELLGKSEGDFLDRSEVELNIETGVIRLPELKPEGSPVIID